jgi:hypothetical protein
MEYVLIQLPEFDAIVSGVDKTFDFSKEGVLGRFDAYYSTQKPSPNDSFLPRDFLYFDAFQGGLVWMYAIHEGMTPHAFQTVRVPAGWYLIYHWVDGDDEQGGKMYQGALEYLKTLRCFELDETEGRHAMGHIVTPSDAAVLQGFAVMRTYLPVKPVPSI